MKRVSPLVALLLAIVASPASAKPTAGAADVDRSPGTSACTNGCLQEIRSCGRAAGNIKDAAARQAQANQCARLGAQCASRCEPARGGNTSAGSTPDLPQAQPSDAGESAFAPSRMPADASAAVNQLTAAFRQQDASRMSASEATAIQAVQQLLQTLCQQLTPNAPNGACVAGGTGPTQLPPNVPLGDRRASDRWTKNLPPDKGAPPGPGASAPPGLGTGALRQGGGAAPPAAPAAQGAANGAGGCFLEGVYTVKGNFADRLQMETPLHAWFAPKATGSTLTITNASDKDVWLGMPVPLNMVVPAGAGLGGKPPFTFELAIYRAKDDQRDTSQDIGVKYWSTDAARCKVGARKPGPTTPDEFGPPFPVPPQDIQ